MRWGRGTPWREKRFLDTRCALARETVSKSAAKKEKPTTYFDT